jgi:hypothetical protein
MDAYMTKGIRVDGIAKIFNANTGECVYEEVSFIGSDGITTSQIKKEIDKILSDYIDTHDGEYYAILERRYVKAK